MDENSSKEANILQINLKKRKKTFLFFLERHEILKKKVHPVFLSFVYSKKSLKNQQIVYFEGKTTIVFLWDNSGENLKKSEPDGCAFRKRPDPRISIANRF